MLDAICFASRTANCAVGGAKSSRWLAFSFIGIKAQSPIDQIFWYPCTRKSRPTRMRPCWKANGIFNTAEGGALPIVATMVRVSIISFVVVTSCVPVHFATPTPNWISIPRSIRFFCAYPARLSDISFKMRSANSNTTTRISELCMLG